MIVGLTGPNASGKGEAAGYLKSKGYRYHSLSDILREESKKYKIHPTRSNLIKLGNRLRREKGASFLARRIIERLTPGDNHVVDSIRNPSEIKELRKLGKFLLIGIDAPVKIRFQRSLKRKRPGDPKTLKEFIEKEAEENKLGFGQQQLRRCLRLADTVVKNISSLNTFYRKIDQAIEKNKKARMG